MDHKDTKTNQRKGATDTPQHAQRFDVSVFAGTGLSLRFDPEVPAVKNASSKTTFRILGVFL
jgi:hypothetical protein